MSIIQTSDDLLTVGEAAGVLRLKASTIRAWLLQRRVPFVKLGRRVFLRRRDIEALVAASVVPATALCNKTNAA